MEVRMKQNFPETMSQSNLEGDLEIITHPVHSLLEPPTLAYSNVTVRRAFIVWMHCGQRNSFQQVCNYFHYLEAMEDKLPPEQRALSRHHEFDLFSNRPPTSQYLNETFPKLYSHHVQPAHITRLESFKNDHCVFKLERFNEIPQQIGATPEEISATSKVIRKYCKSHLIPLRRFFDEFKRYANKCELKHTLANVANYIKNKAIQAELDIINNYPKTFDFLESPTDFDNRDHLFDNEVIKPEARKASPIFIEKDIKLNPTCAAFFNSFNSRYFENKSVSCSPLVDGNSFYNVSYDKLKSLKSRSVESLLGRNVNVRAPDSPVMNFDDPSKVRRV